ncbi:uncharacterized protein LTR77_003320 [Saxophila tyrrhenica]|uniref:Uncharacterized protein n=1 Tax=Saxophila tyrrhenica TaxID=1690608 RepID=A0AAV9PLU7_9PEZI|nr:hypothetical protein LTR77_003320 [Saxophila tyrrhenica]
MPKSPYKAFKDRKDRQQDKAAKKAEEERQRNRDEETGWEKWPTTPPPQSEPTHNEDDDDVAIESDSDDDLQMLQYKKPGSSRSQQSLHSSPTSTRQRQGSTSSQGSVSIASSSLDLSRQTSFTLPTIPERSATPGGSGPRYIHRKHGSKGTQWSLHDRSPSGGIPNSFVSGESPEARSNRNSGLSVAGVAQKDFARNIPGEANSAYPFPQLSPPEEKKSRNNIPDENRLKARDGTLLRPGNASMAPEPPPRGYHKRTRTNTLGGAENDFADPNNAVKSGMAFASARHAPGGRPSPESLRKQRLPTIKPDAVKADSASQISSRHGDIPIAPPPRKSDEESPTRPSFEPGEYTAEELHAYRQLRLAFAHTMILERAGGVLTSLYKDPNWPADVPPMLSSAQNSSIMWAREAAKGFREDAKEHPVYLKFQRNGNDIAFRARNDLIETDGDMSEIKERVENWEEIDKAEGLQEIRLEVGDVDGVELEKESESVNPGERVCLDIEKDLG